MLAKLQHVQVCWWGARVDVVGLLICVVHSPLPARQQVLVAVVSIPDEVAER